MYKVTIGGTSYTLGRDNKELLAYVGINLLELRGQLAHFAWAPITKATVVLHDPRYKQELELNEGEGDIGQCQKYLGWLMKACYDDPGDIIEVVMVKPKPPKGV